MQCWLNTPVFSLPKKEKEWAFYNKSDEDDETRKQTYDGRAINIIKNLKYKERIKKMN